jgi:hypothetical protein
MTYAPFVESPNLLLLAQVAETWGCRPSELLGIGPLSDWAIERSGALVIGRFEEPIIQSPTVALQIDVAAAVALWRWKERPH